MQLCLRHKQKKLRSMTIWNPISEWQPGKVRAGELGTELHNTVAGELGSTCRRTKNRVTKEMSRFNRESTCRRTENRVTKERSRLTGIVGAGELRTE